MLFKEWEYLSKLMFLKEHTTRRYVGFITHCHVSYILSLMILMYMYIIKIAEQEETLQTSTPTVG